MTGGDVGVAVEETTDFGIVVTGIEVVESGFAVEVVTAVAEGVIVGNIGGKPGEPCRYRGGDSAPGIALILLRFFKAIILLISHHATGIPSIFITDTLPSGNNLTNASVNNSIVTYSESET